MSLNNGEKLYCYNHPRRETLLRCNQCERPICTSCAVLTPTGYRCKACVRGQQKTFETAKWWDYPVAILSAVVISGVCSYFVTGLLGIFALIAAPFVGIGIAEAVRFLVRRRRSLALPKITGIAILVGGLLPTLFTWISMIPLILGGTEGQLILSSLVSLLWPAAFSIIAATSAFYRLKGIRI